MVSLCLVAIACAGLPASAGAAPKFGFNDPEATNATQQARLGAPVRRLIVGWNQVQPRRNNWRWADVDSKYNAIRNAGLQPLIVPVAAPCWTAPSQKCRSDYYMVPDRAFDSAWAAFNRALALRYPGAVGFEIWNEPNTLPGFGGRLDPARYVELLKLAYTAIKGVRPEVPVAAGGIGGSPVSNGYALSDEIWVAGLFALGARGYLDAISLHPYPVLGGWDGTPLRYDVSAFTESVDRVRASRDANGGTGLPIWITETGVSTATAAGFPPASTESEQAERLVALLRGATTYDDVEMAILHRVFDGPTTGEKIETGFGVYRRTGTPKRAACAISQELGGALAC